MRLMYFYRFDAVPGVKALKADDLRFICKSKTDKK